MKNSAEMKEELIKDGWPVTHLKALHIGRLKIVLTLMKNRLGDWGIQLVNGNHLFVNIGKRGYTLKVKLERRQR